MTLFVIGLYVPSMFVMHNLINSKGQSFGLGTQIVWYLFSPILIILWSLSCKSNHL